MEVAMVKADIRGKKEEDSFQKLNKDKQLAYDGSLSKRVVKMMTPKDILVLNVKQSQIDGSCLRELLLRRRIRGLDSRIPRHVVSLDEKYLRHCLELIYLSASKAASCHFPENLGSSNIGILSDSLSSLKSISSYARDLTKFVSECPLEAANASVVSPAGEWIVGTITKSKSIMNIMKSPLLCQFGTMRSELNFGRTDLIDDTKSLGSDFMSSPSWLSTSSLPTLENKKEVFGNDVYDSEPLHRSLVSASSSNSSFSDQSSSLVFPGITQGMLKCTWKAGFPHYAYSIDDQEEVYFADLYKAGSPDNKIPDYTYMFYSRASDRKECETHKSDLVGKMRVTTAFTPCPNNSRTMETEFVLFGSDKSSLDEMQTSSRILKKNKGLSKKMVEVFKTSQPSWERNSSKYGGTSAILDNSSLKAHPESCTNPYPLGTANLSKILLPPNLELAAIIVKEHIRDSHQEPEIRGWGLKFLKKAETRQTIASLETSPSGCCMQTTGDCSTTMDILVPEGFHGGPRNRNGGPSSLIERWRSGGRCDCGGWDIGCPLTVLSTRSSINEVSPHADTEGNCKSFDIFIQGSMQGAPVMKMVNIGDGLYSTHFQSTLSALQSLSIAVAHIHTKSPALQSKVYRSSSK